MVKLLKNLTAKDLIFVAVSIAFIFVQVILDLKLPDYTSELTTTVTSGSVSMSDVMVNGGKMLSCAIGSMAASIICGYFAARVAANYSKNLRESIFRKVEDFSSAEINKFSTSSLITRSTNDVMQIQNLIAMGLQIMIKAPILAIYAIRKISNTNVEWTYATLGTVVFIIFIVRIVFGFSMPKLKKVQTLTDKLNNVTRENISGVRVVRAFNAEGYQKNKFEKVNKEVLNNNIFINSFTGLLFPSIQMAMNGLTIVIYMIGAYLMNEAVITERAVVIGNMTAFSQYALQVIMAFLMMVGIFIYLPKGVVSGKRIIEILNTEITIEDGTVKDGNSNLRGTIEFKNVSFAYPGDKKNTIENINFKLSKGETLAIIGSTGSGKTTLINMISRFYDATEGEVYVDGVNVKDYNQEILREKVGLVAQKAALFQGSILDNITYGSKGVVTDEKINRALKISQSEEFVNKLSDKINSHVAQGGSNFSGGQKQRLSIARAIYKDSEILIFDDSFSALDYKTDRTVRKLIKENAKDTTVIIVAQRIGTIKNADKIIVLDEGKIAGAGKHKELLQNCPVYKEIALSQLSQEEL